MSAHNPCPVCGRPLTATAPGGLCPHCLVSGMLDPSYLDGDEVPDAALGAGGHPGDVIGDYELLGLLGRGGMAVVWRARQRSLDRIVALKMIRTGEFATLEEVRRFHNETQTAALLDHPNIIPIYDVGENAGRHYFSMKLVDGGSLASALGGEPEETAAAPLAKRFTRSSDSLAAIAELMDKVARAVHFAHQRGVLHRDLKPANILLETDGNPMVGDFGLARRLTTDSSLTLSGTIIGSPAYMAPEQAAGRPEQVTTAADIYALGAILFHCLTGRPPFQGTTPLDTLRLATEQEPPVPRALNPALDRDLETICLKCLAKNPAQRYVSALALAEDLERWRRGEAITARPLSLAERSWKWARRNPARAAVVGLTVLALTAIGVVLAVSNARVRQAAAETKAQREQTRQNLYAADVFIAHSALEMGSFGLAQQSLAKHRPKPDDTDLRGFEWRWLWERARGESSRIFSGHSNTVTAVAWSPDGRWLASAGQDGWVWLWDYRQGRSLGAMRAYELDPDPWRHGNDYFKAAYTVSFSPDSRLVACCSAVVTRLWRVDEPPTLVAERKMRGRWGLFLKSGELAVAYQWPLVSNVFYMAQANLLELFDQQLQPLAPAWEVTNSLFCLSADGRWLADGRHHEIHLWDLRRRTLVRTFHTDTYIHRLALSPEGTLLAVAYRGRDDVEFLEMPSGNPVGRFAAHPLGVTAVEYSPDGRWLATCGGDESIRLWDSATRKEVRRWRGHGLGANCLAFSPDSLQLLSGGADGDVRVWPLEHPLPPPAITNVLPPLAFSADGRWLISGYKAPAPPGEPTVTTSPNLATATRSTVAAWDLTTRLPVLFTNATPAVLACVSHQPGFIAAQLPTNAPAEVWSLDPQTGQSDLRFRLEGVAASACLAFHPEGTEIVTGHVDGSLCWWEGSTGRLLASTRCFTEPVEGIRFSPNGRLLMCWTYSPRQLQAWETASHRPLTTNNFPGPVQLALAFSPDGEQCVTAGFGSDIRQWRTRTMGLCGVFPRQKGAVQLLAWSPDGRSLAAFSSDGKLHFWHLATGRRLMTLRDEPGESKRLADMTFSSDGQWFAVVDNLGQLHLWHGPPLLTIDSPSVDFLEPY